jgi:hypothetical protein
VVGTATGYLGRYREFDSALALVWLPEGSERKYGLGCDPGHSFNVLCKAMIDDEKFQWIWILGDDHVFAPNLWLNLFARDVDIVVPFCLRRSELSPILHYGEEGKFGPHPDPWSVVTGKSGLLEWDGTCGNAGMLIRRHVLEEMEYPWFRQGQLDPKYSSSDLYFSWAAQKAGFKVYVDLDNCIGHIDHFAIWPRKQDGHWYIDYRPAAVY